MMGRPMFLEPFDQESVTDQPAPPAPPHPEFEAGFVAGHAQAMAEVEAAQDRLNAKLVQTLNDMEFGYSEARRLILEQLAPLFTSLSERLLPAISDLSLASQLAAEILRGAETDLAGPIVVELSDPAQSNLVAELLRNLGRDLPISFDTNSALGPDEAILRRANRETMFDAERTVKSLQDILGAIISENTKEAEDD